MRKKIAAGNWKMNTTVEEGLKLASEVIHMAQDELITDVSVIMAVPFTHLVAVKKLIGSSSNVLLAAQNCHQAASGAFTGEISAEMLKAIGVNCVILGHSERREYYKESFTLLEEKLQAVLQNEMTPIFCCVEKLDVRQSNGQFDLVKEQLAASLFSLSPEDFSKLIIAYEPVWAIGTGVNASDDQAQEMHHFIRKVISQKYGSGIANEVSVLYGVSVKASNAKDLFSCADVDGGLIGGASLDSRGFVDIAKSF